MGRRYASCGLARRDVRDGGRLVQTYQSILGPLLVEMWHSQLGIALASGAVDTWTGQVGGRVAQAPGGSQRPVYAVDGSNFNGKSVVQCQTTGSKFLSYLAGADLFGISDTPWELTVGRWMGAPANNDNMSVLGDVGGSNLFLTTTPNGTTHRHLLVTNPGFPLIDTTLSQSPHAYAMGKTATQLVGAVDGSAQTPVAATNPFGAAVRRVAFGVSANLVSNPSNVAFALRLICTAAPSASQQSALAALIRAEWGTP